MSEIKTEAGEIAVEVMVDILESYIEFIDIAEWATNFADMPYKIEDRFIKTIKERRKKWKPVLEDLKKDLGRQ